MGSRHPSHMASPLFFYCCLYFFPPFSMGTTLHRLTSAVLAGSLALSATPAAALGLGLHAESDSSASANVGRRASLNAHHSANVDADAAVPARCRNFDDEDQDECVRIFKARAELTAQA